jgi:hypothetical protein
VLVKQSAIQNAQISHIVARRADEIRAISTPHRQQTHNGVLRTSALDAVDGSSTGTRVPWMWVL